ncbi:MAG TPA: 50S ribosomal protein L24 [Patescibacteria group bacterium]|nr:50S ribosomal protein L24 [Patescibacteria group bacterium]
MNTLRIKKGDKVKVLRGKDAGKSGAITQVLPKDQQVVVDGVNKMVKHFSSKKKGEKGQRIEFFGPLQISKVALICPKCNKATRVGYSLSKGTTGETQKHRQCKKCKETF